MSEYHNLKFRGYHAQKAYCEKKGLPMFIHEDCTCHRCDQMIFGKGGISEEQAGSRLITGCPFCHASFCD